MGFNKRFCEKSILVQVNILYKEGHFSKRNFRRMSFCASGQKIKTWRNQWEQAVQIRYSDRYLEYAVYNKDFY